MQITVKLFATLRQLTGWSSRAMDLSTGSTLGNLLEQLSEEYPQLNLSERTFYAAINQEYAQRAQPLSDGDEVALLPPMSGGSISVNLTVFNRSVTGQASRRRTEN